MLSCLCDLPITFPAILATLESLLLFFCTQRLLTEISYAVSGECKFLNFPIQNSLWFAFFKMLCVHIKSSAAKMFTRLGVDNDREGVSQNTNDVY